MGGQQAHSLAQTAVKDLIFNCISQELVGAYPCSDVLNKDHELTEDDWLSSMDNRSHRLLRHLFREACKVKSNPTSLQINK